MRNTEIFAADVEVSIIHSDVQCERYNERKYKLPQSIKYEEKYVSVWHGRSCPVAIKHPNCFSVFDAIIKVDTEG